MAFNIIYNTEEERKIIENGEVKDDLNLQWKKNSIDKSVLNNINRSPKILVGERIGFTEEEEQQQGVTEFNAEIEINGSNFITNEDQRVLLNPLVTDIDSGDIIDDDRYDVSWYLNDSLLDVPNIFELDTTQLEDESNNIIKLEVLINDRILVDKSSILKYLDFESSTGNGGGNGDNGQQAEGGVLQSDEGIRVISEGSGFKVGEPLVFIATGNGINIVVWAFGDGDGASGNNIRHVYTDDGVYNVQARIFKDFEGYNPKAKIKIVDSDSKSSNGNDGGNNDGGSGGGGRESRDRGNRSRGGNVTIGRRLR